MSSETGLVAESIEPGPAVGVEQDWAGDCSQANGGVRINPINQSSR